MLSKGSLWWHLFTQLNHESHLKCDRWAKQTAEISFQSRGDTSTEKPGTNDFINMANRASVHLFTGISADTLVTLRQRFEAPANSLFCFMAAVPALPLFYSILQCADLEFCLKLKTLLHHMCFFVPTFFRCILVGYKLTLSPCNLNELK